jgi:DNA-binding MarR family transcriptional regulator
MGQTKALWVLLSQGPLPVGALARSLGIGDAEGSLLADKLEERGFVRREQNSSDRRRTLLLLTDEGRDLVQSLRARRDSRFAYWLGQLSEEDLVGLLQGLDALLTVVGKDRESDDE